MSNDLRLLHALRIRHLATTRVLAEMVDAGEVALARRCARLRTAGLLQLSDDEPPEWWLTERGAVRHSELLAVELQGLAVAHAVIASRQAMLPLSMLLTELLFDIDAAQLTDRRAFLERFHAVHQRMTQIARRLADDVPRYRTYEARFHREAQRIEVAEADDIGDAVRSYLATWHDLESDLDLTIAESNR